MSLLSCWPGGLERRLPEKPHSLSTQLISADGEFHEKGFKSFLRYVKYHEHGVESNALVVAIIGQQSSGKSTLMNHLFHTNFKEMDALRARGATTKGIWIAEALETKPLTIAVDLEGTDGSERGEDDKAFERRSALFALVISDVLIVNMCCKNVGLDQGGNRPLLKIIFEAMMRYFPPHKTTLLFVLRDKTKSPIEMLKSDLTKDVKKIWETALKPPGHENTPLSQVFNVEVAALSNYESRKDLFAEEVARLSSRLFDSIGRRNQDVSVPGSEIISFNGAKITWDIIKGCKDLDFPSHKVMVSTVRCEEIAMEKLRLFASNEEWLALEEAATISLVTGFSRRISSILNKYLTEYDRECMYYDNKVRGEKLEYLKSEASKVVRPAYMNTLDHRRSEALKSFDTQLKEALSGGGGFAESVRTCQQACVRQFDEQCGSDDAAFSNPNDVSNVRRDLLRGIEDNWLLVRAEKLPQIAEQQRERLGSKFGKKLLLIVNDPDPDNDDIWGRIRSLLRSESDAAALALPSALADFELDQPTVEKMVDELRQSAKELVVKKFKEVTEDVVTLLNHKFVIKFVIAMGPTNSEASNEIEELIQPTEEDAYLKCVKHLSTMAVIRLDEREGEGEGNDRVESVLLHALMPTVTNADSSPDPLDSPTWEQEEVTEEMTLITPVRCKNIWNQFKAQMEEHYARTMVVQEQFTGARNWQRYTWVILGVLALGIGGYGGFMFLTRVTNNKVVFDSMIYAMKAIATAAATLAVATKVIDEILEATTHLEAISEATNFTELRRRPRNFFRNLNRALRSLCEYLNSILQTRGSTMATA